MAREHEAIESQTRRRSPPWDKLKFIILLSVLIAFVVSSKVNAPFTTFGEAVREMWNENFGRFLLVALPLEVLRQLHYLLAERFAGYNGFWADRFFGGVERQAQKRFKPWTRFRLARYVRVLMYLLILGTIVDFFSDDVANPVQAVVELPQIIVRNLDQYFIFLMYPLLLISQFGLLFWFLSRGGVDTVMPEEIKTRYKDVWGQDHVVELVRENVGFLEKPDEIEAKGGYIPGGILLWGPPGTGKTLIAEATAGEVGSPFVFVDPGAFINMFFGVGILKVKGLFRKLRKMSLRHGGVVVFFDEADSLGSRGEMSGVGQQSAALFTDSCHGFAYASSTSQQLLLDDVTRSFENSTPGPTRIRIPKIIMGAGGGGGGGMGTLQALLTEISGLTKPRGLSNRVRKMLGMRPKLPPKYRIFIMMASNMPQSLDPALLRPGRIDRIYRVGYPSREGRIATLQGYLDKVDHTLTEEQVTDLAIKTPYYSGAKIKDLVNEALIIAMRDDRETIEWNDIWKAKLLKELGPSERTEYIAKERHAIAVHEACHAVVAHLMLSDQEIDMATIERHSNALGMVKPIQLEDRVTRWRTEFDGEVMVFLASLVGEKMFFEGDNSSGVSSDLRAATSIAAHMQGLFGMGTGISSMATLADSRWGTSDSAPDIIEHMGEEVETMLQALYVRTEALLADHQDEVLAIAAALEERKTISGAEVAQIMGSEPGTLADRQAGTWRLIDPNRALAAATARNGRKGEVQEGAAAEPAAKPSDGAIESEAPDD
jgi:ATP-dependent Zn protease